MTSYPKPPTPRTTVWRRGVSGLSLVTTFQGLPYGTAATAFIAGFGEAVYSGVQKTGSGISEAIVEVEYTLK